MAEAWPKATFLPALRRGNVMGALDMGLAPGLLPGLGEPRRGSWLVRGGVGQCRRAGAAMLAPCCLRGRVDARHRARGSVRIPWATSPTAPWPRRLWSAGFVVAVDGLPVGVGRGSPTSCSRWPIAHERTGTTTNIEGRVTRLAQKWCRPANAGRTGWWRPSSPMARCRLGVTSAAELWDGDRAAPPRPTPGSPGSPSTLRRHARRDRRPRRPRRCGSRPPGPGAFRPHGHTRHRRRRGPGRPASSRSRRAARR